ncbi:hypothetical protein E2C01_016348 [Portunus trituberculatus]|uniref:Uncharacterized protein n=1 Tax=Portunus trituberculatus TaxID=210409 RepID=A0A5B7DQI5_PORTR|nr:hypothetical protein [Portunus trituberculatus]
MPKKQEQGKDKPTCMHYGVAGGLATSVQLICEDDSEGKGNKAPRPLLEGLPLVSASAGWGQVAVALDQMFVLEENYSSLVLHLILEEAVSLVLWMP